jgi:voltage-gated potassium channel
MDRAKQILISVLLSIALIGFGCIGYMTIEDWGFADALYMTIITIATVGYGEVHKISIPGRMFTLVLIILGVGYFLYVVGNIIQFLVEGRIRLVLGRRKLDTQINRLKGHFIICGYGRIGRELTRYLTQKYIDVVIIERNSNRVSTMDNDGILYLVGEATDESIMENAGIHRARGLVTAVATDADNVFLVLIAKQLNPNIFIVARAEQNSTKKTLLAAGADKVISPYDIGARRMAHAVLRPAVIEFLEMAFADDSTDIQLEEIQIQPSSELIGVTLQDSGVRQNMDVNIIAFRKPEGRMVFNPKADDRFEAGDTVIAVGSARSIKQFERILSG